MRRHRVIAAVVAVGCGALVAGCADDPSDFQRSAERFIEGDQMAQQAGTSFTGAVCARPESTEVGGEFGCSATDAGGNIWTFDVVIATDSRFEITGHLRG